MPNQATAPFSSRMSHRTSPEAMTARNDGLEPLNVWLLSGYHTGSHQAWAEGYQRYSLHHVRLITLDGRFWKWRMQGGAINLSIQAQSLVTLPEAALPETALPDVVLATDMVHLPVWTALTRRILPPSLPLICYMHENQLTYPWRPGEKVDLTYAMINWLSQLTADWVLFNTHYHLDDWFGELPSLLKHYPDYNHLELVDQVRARSAVSPVGIEIATPDGASQTVEPSVEPSSELAPLILWNQRWEYDKRPDRFFALLYRLQEAQVPFRLAVAGENFRNVPEEFETARRRLADHIVHWGYAATRAAYLALLRQADVVISTADHEFFGISILEAIAAGAFALLPTRLSYPELVPAALHATHLYADEEELWQKTRVALQMSRTELRAVAAPLRRHAESTYGWPVTAQKLDQWIAQVVNGMKKE